MKYLRRDYATVAVGIVPPMSWAFEKDVGIAVDVKSSELQTHLADVATGNVQLYTLQWVGVTDPDMLRRVFHSSQMPPNGLNRVFYTNPAVDEFIDRAARDADENGRRESYARAQQLIAADVPYISLWTKKNVAVFRPDIGGVRLSPIADFTFLKDVSRPAGDATARAHAEATAR